MKKILLVISLAFTCNAYCQADKVYIAIMPFLSTNPQNFQIAAQLQEKTLSLLRKKTDLAIIDRSKDSLIIEELKKQLRSFSIDGKGMADQGKLSGANEVLLGELSSVGISERQTTAGDDKQVRYSCTISFSLSITDVTSGTTKYQTTIDGSTKGRDVANDVTKGISNLFSKGKTLEKGSDYLLPPTKEAAIEIAINSAIKDIEIWLNKLYPVTLNIISVETRYKNYPETLLIAGLDETFTKKSTGKIIEMAYISDASGKKYRQEKKVGAFKVIERQGDVCLCKLTDGENELEQKIAEKKTLLVIKQ